MRTLTVVVPDTVCNKCIFFKTTYHQFDAVRTYGCVLFKKDLRPSVEKEVFDYDPGYPGESPEYVVYPLIECVEP